MSGIEVSGGFLNIDRFKWKVIDRILNIIVNIIRRNGGRKGWSWWSYSTNFFLVVKLENMFLKFIINFIKENKILFLRVVVGLLLFVRNFTWWVRSINEKVIKYFGLVDVLSFLVY